MIIRRKTFEDLNNSYIDLQLDFNDLKEQYEIALQQIAYLKMELKKYEPKKEKKVSRTKKTKKEN